MSACASDTSSAQSSAIQTVCIWFKAFIPSELEGVEPVPEGAHKDKSMFRSPGPIEAWFLTDQRSFSSDPDAAARMHSEIELDLVDFRVVRELHKCDATVQVDHLTGAEDCREIPDTSDMYFTDVQFSRAEQQVSMHLHGSTKNACMKLGPVKVSPNLDCDLDIVLTFDKSGREAALQVDGQIEVYPAFEMYITLNDGSPNTVFQEPAEPGSTPLNLVGPPQREVHKSMVVSYPRIAQK